MLAAGHVETAGVKRRNAPFAEDRTQGSVDVAPHRNEHVADPHRIARDAQAISQCRCDRGTVGAAECGVDRCSPFDMGARNAAALGRGSFGRADSFETEAARVLLRARVVCALTNTDGRQESDAQRAASTTWRRVRSATLAVFARRRFAIETQPDVEESIVIPVRVPGRGGDAGKIVTAAEAVGVIRNGDTVATSGFVGIGVAEEVIMALEERFVGDGTPRDLTLVFAAGQGDGGRRGLNRWAHEGLARRVIGGHWGLVPALGKLAVANKIEAYNLPQGVISCMYRDIAGGRPGHMSHVGLGTFVDPRHDGGRINARTTEPMVELITTGGREALIYRTFPIHVAIIRATSGDADGNLTMEREALTLEALAIASAAHNSGGLVIAQVERIAERGTLNPRQVKIPGALVDCVVRGASTPNHWQTFAQPSTAPAYSAASCKVPDGHSLAPAFGKFAMSARKIIARRAALELLAANNVVNLGIGMPEGVASVASEEKSHRSASRSRPSPGVIGGIPAGGLNFGAAVNHAGHHRPAVPIRFLRWRRAGRGIPGPRASRFARATSMSASFGSRSSPAPGGFINISQNAKRVVFVGTFTAGGLEIAVEDGRLKIVREGTMRKFVDAVEHRTYSGAVATARGQQALYITERCVFKLTADGLELTEVAPGIDIERDILALMGFAPIIKGKPRCMDPRIFSSDGMGLREQLLSLPLDQRLVFDAAQGIFFANFEGLTVRDTDDVERLRVALDAVLDPIGRKVQAIVDYDNFRLLPDAENAYFDMVRDNAERHYTRVTRYTTSAFLRTKLGEQLARRNASPHVFESSDEAKAHLGRPV